MSRFNPTALSWGNTTAFVNELNQNFQDLVPLIDTLLSREADGEPNTIQQNLDINGFDLLNVGQINCDVLLIDNKQIPSLEDIQESYIGYLEDLQAIADSTEATLSQYVDDAEAAKEASETAQQGAEASALEAEHWANYPENSPVPEGQGEFSAKHYSEKAAASAAGVNLPAIQTGDKYSLLQAREDETGWELYPYDPLANQIHDPLGLGYRDGGVRQTFNEHPWHPDFEILIQGDTGVVNIPNNTTVSVGAVGSGADYEFPAMNPAANAKGVILGYAADRVATAAGRAYWRIYLGGRDSTRLTDAPIDLINTVALASQGLGGVGQIGTIPLTPMPTTGNGFYLRWTQSNTSPGDVDSKVSLFVIGYTY